MYPRRTPSLPVGAGEATIPYDQSGGMMSTGGMQVPEPGGTMKKMQFEFTDPAEQQAQQAQQIPQGAGVPPAGMQQPPQMPAGLDQGQPQGGPSSVFGAMAGNADQFGQGPDSSMFTDDMLAGMLQEDPLNPVDLQADQMNEQLMGGQASPELQMQMMQAARRMGGF